MLLSVVFPAKTCLLLVSERGLKMQMELPLDLDCFTMPCESSGGARQDICSLKTCLDCSRLTAERTLLRWLEKWLGVNAAHREMDGKIPVVLSEKEGCLNGAVWMRNILGWRKGGCAVSLSLILETGSIDRRYFLSSQACKGILRRAERRGKALPPMLLRALREVAEGSSGQAKAEDKTR
jgi:hypothetical protein